MEITAAVVRNTNPAKDDMIRVSFSQEEPAFAIVHPSEIAGSQMITVEAVIVTPEQWERIKRAVDTQLFTPPRLMQ